VGKSGFGSSRPRRRCGRTESIAAALVAATLIAGAAPARAEYVPIVPSQIASLGARRARLFVARPARTRGRGPAAQLYPGDVVTAVGEHRLGAGDRPSPTFIEVKLPDGSERAMHIEELSARPLDFSYRDRMQGFAAFTSGLARDAVRLVELYKGALEKARWRRPSPYDQEKKIWVDDWYRLEALRAQFRFQRMRFFDLGYSRPNERTLLEREKEWLPARGEEFITKYAGRLAPEEKKRLQQIYLTFNSLDSAFHLCFKVGQLLEAIERKQPSSRYKGLEPGHRARLQAEDIAKSHTEITEVKAKLVVTLTDARARLVALGVRPR
jgi:hypothetical protein